MALGTCWARLGPGLAEYSESIWSGLAFQPSAPEHRWLAVRVVAAITGQPLCTVRVDPAWNVLQVKGLIEREAGVPWHEQHLLHDGRPLGDGEVLARSMQLTSVLSAVGAAAISSPGFAGGSSGSSRVAMQARHEVSLVRAVSCSQDTAIVNCNARTPHAGMGAAAAPITPVHPAAAATAILATSAESAISAGGIRVLGDGSFLLKAIAARHAESNPPQQVGERLRRMRG
ncbi:unnamed protein product [Polarella glacialis]|nr:unnamed protein product [Polarella glacialis]CAE8636416.1 unnamed protein product [Polarella glacialis]